MNTYPHNIVRTTAILIGALSISTAVEAALQIDPLIAVAVVSLTLLAAFAVKK